MYVHMIYTHTFIT